MFSGSSHSHASNARMHHNFPNCKFSQCFSSCFEVFCYFESATFRSHQRVKCNIELQMVRSVDDISAVTCNVNGKDLTCRQFSWVVAWKAQIIVNCPMVLKTFSFCPVYSVLYSAYCKIWKGRRAVVQLADFPLQWQWAKLFLIYADFQTLERLAVREM